jgi:hypothetical protein
MCKPLQSLFYTYRHAQGHNVFTTLLVRRTEPNLPSARARLRARLPRRLFIGQIIWWGREKLFTGHLVDSDVF